MLGAIAGDIIGSIYEHRPIKTTRFPLFHPLCRFTDDTVLTVALAASILHGTGFVGLMKQYYRAYPRAGYGGSFHQWAQSNRSDPYNSWGNGSAMRVSPVGLFVVSCLVQLGMWSERFMLIVTSLHRDFLPSSWRIYTPSWVDWTILGGTCCFFLFLFLLFLRFFPFIPSSELKEMRHDLARDRALEQSAGVVRVAGPALRAAPGGSHA